MAFAEYAVKLQPLQTHLFHSVGIGVDRLLPDTFCLVLLLLAVKIHFQD